MSASLRTRGSALAAAGVAAAMVVAALAASPAAQAAAPATPVRTLTGSTSDGSQFSIRVPPGWSAKTGTLLLYSHGYRPLETWSRGGQPQPTAPAGTAPQVASDDATAQQLLARGYALAGSSYARNGWAVADGVRADELLVEQFRRSYGTPQRLYAWGDSLGGLVTQVFAEKNPQTVAGVAPMCGLLGGPVDNLDLALDFGVAIKALIDPSLALTGFATWADAQVAYDHVYSIVMNGLADPTTQAPMAARLVAIRMMLDAPAKTSTSDGVGPTTTTALQHATAAAAESVLSGLFYATLGRYDVEQRVAGNPTTNVGVSYLARVSNAGAADHKAAAVVTADERDYAALGFSAGLLRSYARTVDWLGARVQADGPARAAFAATGTPTGVLSDPTITLHTAYDPLVLVQNEARFAGRVAAKGRTGLLRQLYVTPPSAPWFADASAMPPTGAPAAYGAGHCAFTPAQRVRTLTLLDSWVRSRTAPTPIALGAAETAVPGLTRSFTPSAWPVR